MTEKIPIYVVGFPKSGNSWLSRLLGDALDSPVEAMKGKIALADEGFDRRGPFVIHQDHLVGLPEEDNARIVYILRDPRDVIVSNYFYWDLGSIKETIERCAEGRKPFRRFLGMNFYISKWLDKYRLHIDSLTRYEWLNTRPFSTLLIVLAELGYKYETDLVDVIERQSFKERLRIVEEHPERLSYNQGIQRKLMRKGVVGDWVNHFTFEDAELMEHHFGDLLRKYAYAHDGWWKKEQSDKEAGESHTEDISQGES
jgi:hypothetical protein